MPGHHAERSPVRRTSPHPSRNGKTSPWPSTSLNHVHITDALLRSPDDGVTLDLSHKGLTDIGESGVEELATIGREDLVEDESSIQRITLGHNHLTTLPMAFALLSRLRYLNLKSNNIIVFPDVLTVMPSLEILDIGRNKIKRFPSQPGSLVNLKVFSISRNKITRLPTYFKEFHRLTLFQIDHNPIEWPPRDIMENGGGADGSQEMKDWIRGIQKWIEDNTTFPDDRKSSILGEYVDSPAHEPSDEPADTRFRFPVRNQSFDSGIAPHLRSFSIESDVSINSDINRVQNGLRASDIPSPIGPPRLYTNPNSSFPGLGAATSLPSRSPDRYLPTPEESVASADEDLTQASQQHGRNASFASSTRKPTRPLLLTKKSLPDLRTAKVQFGPGRRETGLTEPAIRDSGVIPADFHQPSPVSSRQDSSSSEDTAARSKGARPSPFAASTPITSSPTALERPIPSMDIERNSYFRRLSTLPSSTISKTIPDSLLSLVDAVRGILFALSQIYQTLQHYTVYAIDDRLSSVLTKVLDPASTYLTQLINALDRFDSMSRRHLPHPSVCRTVVESCKDNVAVFGKAVSVLALQLKVLATGDDVRYTRQMLLTLYGATAEISNAWQSIVPHIAAVEPLLRDHRPPPASKGQGSTWSTMPSVSESAEEEPSTASPLTYSLFSPGTTAYPLMRSHSAQPPNKVLINRRHAGSFSSRDVEVGKTLPSYVEPLHRATGVIRGGPLESPVSRTGLRSATGSPALPSPPILHQPIASSSRIDPYARARDAHSRQTSLSSLKTSSNQPSPRTTSRPPLLDIPTNSTTLVDKEALDAMTTAVEAAPVVWEMIDEILNDSGDEREDLRETLAKAEAVTISLRDNIRLVQENDPVADRKTLREDAHVFVKTVVQLSNAIKSYGEGHPVSPKLRSSMVKLTNATEEFVILLHVSSFSPSATPRPFSPMVPSQPNGAGLAPEDGKLGANLSRSRSALPPSSSKLTPSPRDGSRSAMAHQQTFKLPNTPRPGASRDHDNAGSSLGS
ncbi:hypothetical protein GLOTRDRAFT_72712 [Gloeophyllum trabeum ATCC 11539]|uniref:L domain-like protein n=1 Tax=Gloeophyllum trabeum (strain ATCC 11539 / FP-39264 / Madison 617) TaxID=670483 RepID=S7RY76_GLOTA|nr:uncharacterized protein GLOTRDRAFT_72712 [Gloeophyllum trabeum ATCC 11539]EPQ58359.1 hypothetical protein GLOTRDRAFT_72712 [Gloeophyllum trabeum ATCC 11539]